MQTRRIGDEGERIAEQYLLARGASILARNYAAQGGEIDLIVLWEGVIVFVEVKYRSTPLHGTGAESVTLAKRRRIGRAALSYLHAHHLLDRSARFDVIEIMPPDIRHLKSAFELIQ